MRPNTAGSDPWVQQARSVPIERELARRGIKLKRSGHELIGPCPRCGGDDRFGVNVTKQIFNCRGCGVGGDIIDLVQHLDGVDFIAAATMLTGEPPQAKPNGNGRDDAAAEPKTIAAARYKYEDEAGNLAFGVVRIEYQNADGSFVQTNGKRKKTFKQGRPDPERPGKWLWNVDGVPVVPYLLPEVVEAIASSHAILIVEGEAKVDLLRSWNIPATTNAGGAGKWKPEHSTFLHGADVVIMPDSDMAGRKHCDTVGASLQGIAASVRVLELPGLAPKQDIVDWATKGGTVDQLHNLIEREAKPWAPRTEEKQAEETKAEEQRQEEPQISGHDEHKSSPLTIAPWWRDPEAIPRRQFLYDRHYIRKTVSATIAAGGRAKTTRATYDALSMVTGRELIGGERLFTPPLRVGILNGEEDQDELDRRLAATCQHYRITEAHLGGRLFAQSVRKTPLRLATMVKNVATINSEAMAWLLAFVQGNQLDVLVIDPLVSFHRVPENDNGAMDLLVKDAFGVIADETNSAVEICHHSGKAKQGQTETAVEDSRGASALIWAARSARVLNFMSPEEANKLGIAEDQRRLHIRVANGKANMAPIGQAEWIKLVVEILPNGDEIAVSSSWKPPNPFEGVTVADMELAKNWSRTGEYRSDARSPEWFGYKLAEHLRLDVSCGDRGPQGAAPDIAKVKQILAQWLKNKVLATEERTDSKSRKRVFIVPGSKELSPRPEAEDVL